jgi:alpha-tubulin suppressor-like RCC1 family protein
MSKKKINFKKKISLILKNSLGECADKTFINRLNPVEINYGDLEGQTVIDLKAGSFHICALTNNESAFCWGNNW